MTRPGPAVRSGGGGDLAGLVDVVVVTHHSAEHLAGALSPLVGAEQVASITVVDNASTDDTVAVARGFGVDVAAGTRNAGFGAGADLGVRRGRSPFALLLNPDASISPDDLALLVRGMAADDRLAALAPRVVHPDGAEQRVVWPLTTSRDAWVEALALHRFRPLLPKPSTRTPPAPAPGPSGPRPATRAHAAAFPARSEEVGEQAASPGAEVVEVQHGFVIGACLLLRRAAYDEVGGFDQRYWLYGEESDLQARLAGAGWRIGWLPVATAVHVGGASGAGLDRVVLEHAQRGDERFVLDREGTGGLVSLRLARSVGSAWRSLAPVRSAGARDRRAHHRARLARTTRALLTHPTTVADDLPPGAQPAGDLAPGGLVVASLEAWDDVWRRNQHLVTQLLALDPQLRVLFVEPPLDVVHRLRTGHGPARRRGLRSVRPDGRVLVLQPLKVWPRLLGPMADRSLHAQAARAARRAGFDRPTVWVNDVHLAGLGDAVGGPEVVDLTDDWLDADLPARERERLAALEADALRQAAAVVACSPALVARKAAHRADIALIPNAVDVERFRRPADRPTAMPSGPVAVYVGTLHTDRLDVGLVEELAQASAGEGRVVLVGPDALDDASRARLDAAGVVRTGPVPHEEVPGWLQHAEAVVVPHLVNPFTESLDPIKAYESAAVDTPTVATPVAGFRELAADVDHVHVVDRAGFVPAVLAHLGATATATATATVTGSGTGGDVGRGGTVARRSSVPTWADRAVAFADVLRRARTAPVHGPGALDGRAGLVPGEGATIAGPSGDLGDPWAGRDGLRVVALSHCARLSGAEIYLERLALGAEDVAVHVVLAEDGPLVARLRSAGATVEVRPLDERFRTARRDGLGLGAVNGVRAIAGDAVRLRARLRQLAPDVVHVNTLKAALYGGTAARAAGLPVVWQLHEMLDTHFLPARIVEPIRQLTRRLPTVVLANSAATAATVPTDVDVRVVPCPLPPGLPSPANPARNPASSARLPGHEGVGGAITVAMVGRITPWKGQHVFLEAFARAFPDGTSRALVVGDALFADAGGPEAAYRDGLHALVDELGLGDRVTFTGFVDDVPGLLADVDVVVHASVEPEPFGQVVIEAMAVGRPVVAAAAGGPAEIVTDEVDGLLVPPGDVDALAAALVRLADDAELRDRLGEQARRRVERYRTEVVAAEVREVWADAARRRMGRSGRSRPPRHHP